MAVFFSSCPVRTNSKIELVNITGKIRALLEESSIGAGLINIFTPHTTAALTVNEDESRLVSDFTEAYKDLIPWDKNYAHNRIDHNAPAHIVAGLIGNSLSIPLRKGDLQLGTWQAILFIELDGPRDRRVEITVIGE